MIPELFTPNAAPFRLDGTNGQAVVAVHGFTGIPGHFTPLAEFLNQRGYTVNVPLVSGHGVDPGHLATADADTWLESVLNAVNAVADHRRVHLVGLSLGGLLAILAAARTAAATITTINSPILVRDKRLYLAPIAHRFVPPVEWSEGATPGIDDEVAHLEGTLPGYHVSSAAELTKTMFRAYRTARRLRRPSLVIQSRTDESVNPRSGVLLASALGPQCRLVWLEESIHNALLGRARETVQVSVLERIS